MKLKDRVFNWLSSGRIVVDSSTGSTEYQRKQFEAEQAVKSLTHTLASSTGNYIPSGFVGIKDINLKTPAHGDFFNQNNSLNIKLTPANGGTIVAIHTTTNSQPDLYVISDEKELEKELGKIMTMSVLKR